MYIITDNGPKALDLSFTNEVKRRCGQEIELCYQCQKCASGCPIAEYGEFDTNQVLRMIQFGLKDELLKSKAIWICLGCETCGARCPNGIRIAAVMDALREMALQEGVTPGEKDINFFHQCFLDSVKSLGRTHEGSMLMKYKLKSGHLMEDVGVGIKLFFKGKMSLLPHSVKSKTEVRRIFDWARKK